MFETFFPRKLYQVTVNYLSTLEDFKNAEKYLKIAESNFVQADYCYKDQKEKNIRPHIIGDLEEDTNHFANSYLLRYGNREDADKKVKEAEAILNEAKQKYGSIIVLLNLFYIKYSNNM